MLARHTRIIRLLYVFEMSSYDDNHINDNKMNAKKSGTHQLKQLLKPLFSLLKKNNNKKSSSYKKSPQPDFYNTSEIEDNLANEILENTILEEIDNCSDFAAVPVYNQGLMDIVPIFRGERYIPVHFAKTEAGTFFWTSMMGADYEIAYDGGECITEKQIPELQVPCDRWAQAWRFPDDDDAASALAVCDENLLNSFFLTDLLCDSRLIYVPLWL